MLYEERQLEREERGETSLELVAVQYTGPRHSVASTPLNTHGMWPGTRPLVPSVTYVALVPDEGVAFLENRNDLDVSYEPADIAAAFLSRNYLPTRVFGQQMDARLNDRVMDALDMEFQGVANEDGNREALRAIAGDEAVDEPGGDDEPSRAEYLAEEYTREELKDAVKDLREDSDDVSLNSKKTEFAEWLADRDADRVNDALEG